MKQRCLTLILIALCASALAGCGKKDDVRPPAGYSSDRSGIAQPIG